MRTGDLVGARIGLLDERRSFAHIALQPNSTTAAEWSRSLNFDDFLS
jgi:hypothetical protein